MIPFSGLGLLQESVYWSLPVLGRCIYFVFNQQLISRYRWLKDMLIQCYLSKICTVPFFSGLSLSLLRYFLRENDKIKKT